MSNLNELLEKDAEGYFEDMSVGDEAESLGMYQSDESYGIGDLQ